MKSPGYESMTTDQLKAELKAQKAKEDEAYQLFTRCAVSKGAGYVKAFSEAGATCRQIRQELSRRAKDGR